MKSKVIPMRQTGPEWAVETAVVKGAAGDAVMVEVGGSLMNAAKSFGLLVAPEAGDTVLVARSERECWVLNVLERPDRPDVSLEFPGSVRLSAPEGRIDLVPGTDLNLMAPGKTRLLSGEAQIAAGQIIINADRISTQSREAETHVQSIRTFAGAIVTVAKSINQRADTLMRWIEGIETLHIGNLVQTVRHSMVLHSRQAVITAKDDVRIDGERIHLG